MRVGNRNVGDTEELQIALIRQFTDDGVIPLRVRRDGSERSLTLRVGDDRRAMTEPGKLLPGLGFDLATWNANTLVHEAPPGSAGERAGLRAGDRLLAVDGQPVANSTEFVAMVNGAPGRDISIEVERGGERLRIVAPVPRVMEQGRAIGRLGITLQEGPRAWPPGLVEIHRSGPIDAALGGVAKTWEMSSLTVQMLCLAFLAIISVSLGVLNLMPVPLLDGGQVVYQVVEAVKGTPLSERAQLFGQQIGIALLVVLMSLAFYNDISRHLN